MSKAEDHALLEGFLFALRVYPQAYEHEVPASEGDRPWDLLHEVVEGKVTLASSPADLLRRFPDTNPEFADMMWRNVNRLMARDREYAQRLIDAMDEWLRSIEGST